MKNVILKSLAIVLSVVIVFCCLTEPLSVSASDTPDLTLVESDYTSSEVAQLIAGVDDAVLVVILIITGFIALTYITLRNVEAPIQFSSTDGFFDKCQVLGQYMLDHIDDNVKDIFYSIYEFVTAGNITSISSVPKLNLTTVGTFFAKIGAWLGGSFVSSVSTVSQGLFNLFDTSILTSLNTYSYASEVLEYVISMNPTYSVSDLVGYARYGSPYWGAWFWTSNPDISYSDYVCVIGTDKIVVGTITDGYFNYSYECFFPFSSVLYFAYQRNDSSQVAPNVSFSSNDLSFDYEANSSTYEISLTRSNIYLLNSFLSFILSLGFSSVYTYENVTSSMTNVSTDLFSVVSGGATTTSASDTVTVPLSDELVLQIADVAAAAAAGTIATTKDYYDELIAGLALTITSALSGSNFTMPEGDYYIPSLDNIWKYVEYMFTTLGSWIIFAGKCIQCVTVGEGGLSWIFYGGFIFLICGGIVGKILLG